MSRTWPPDRYLPSIVNFNSPGEHNQKIRCVVLIVCATLTLIILNTAYAMREEPDRPKSTFIMTLCTTLSFSYTIVGTHQGEPDPKRWPLSIVPVPVVYLGGPLRNLTIARNWTTHIGFFIIWATNIHDDGKYLSGDGPICNSEARQCGLYYHTKNHTLAFLGRSDLLRRTCVQEAKSSRSSLCGLVIFFFFSFLSFFFSILLTRGCMGMRASSQKQVQKTGAESEG